MPREDGLWEVAADWKTETSYGTVLVRRGFVTDGASVPRMAWLLAGHPMETPRVYAALAHDWLYAAHVISRETADRIYGEILERYRAKWRVWVELQALKLFGREAWEGHGPDDELFARMHGAFAWRNGNNESKGERR